MPNCFTLTQKGNDEPSTFVDIDEKLCAHLGVEPHPKNYLYGWYDSIGLGVAMGKTWDQMRTWWDNDSPMQEVINYLEEHYIPDAWYQSK